MAVVLIVAPRLAATRTLKNCCCRLTLRTNRRIHHHLSEPEMAKQLLSERHIGVAIVGQVQASTISDVRRRRQFRLCPSFAERCRYQFVFQEPNEKTTFVAYDAAHCAQPSAIPITDKAKITKATGEYVTDRKITSELKPGRMMVRGRKNLLPPDCVLKVTALGKVIEVETQMEQFKVVPGRFIVQSAQG